MTTKRLLETNYRHVLIGLTVLFGLAACTPFPKNPPEELPAPAQARALEAQGRYRAAAKAYIRAGTAQPSRQKHFELKAASALLQGGRVQAAQDLLGSMAPHALGPVLRLRYRLLAARLAIARQEAEKALALAEKAESLGPSVAQQIALYRIRIQAYKLKGHLLTAIRERIQLASLLSDPQAVRKNQRAIWHALVMLPPDKLEAWRRQSLSNTLKGWLELARIFQRHQAMPLVLQRALNLWQKRYPGHPALLSLLRAETDRAPLMPYQPETIALLLPMEGRFASAAAAVRDGFLAAYYNSRDSHWTPTIRFYVVKTHPETGESNVQRVYRRARKEGADFVVGPLTKQALARLAKLDKLPVPTLALNHLDQPPASVANLYQLALSPEEEARSVAERAWHDGYRRALILVPENEWGERMRQAFAGRWRQLGGEVLAFQSYDPAEEDFSHPITRLLNRRREPLKPSEGGLSHGTVFIFLAAFPQQARQIMPEFRFYWDQVLPVYSTSHAYAGYPNPSRDRDLNGLNFCGIPWVLNKAAQTDPAYRSLAAAYPEKFKRLKPLYALGVDAYRIIPYLKAMQHVESMRFEGATGTLRMDSNHYLWRELSWAHFENGLPQPGTEPPLL